MLQSNQIVQYEESTRTATFTGPFSASQIVNVLVKRINKVVTVEIPAVNGSASLAAVTNAVASGVIPAGMRPISSMNSLVGVTNNNLLINNPGKMEINTNGDIIIYADILTTGLFSILGNNGWQRNSITYFLP